MQGPVCQLMAWDASFLSVWAAISVLSLVSLFAFSGITFYFLYWSPTYNQWKYKINPAYPPPQKIKEEIIVMIQGLLFSTEIAQGYCGIEPHGYPWLILSALIVWFFSDFYEFFYHWCGHRFHHMWKMHKGHHAFFNPTPFAVVADNPIDQLFRAAPLLFFPFFFPINMDMIFTMYSIAFYFNGLIQHSGYEFEIIDGHNEYILTSYHHYLHHAKSSVGDPFYNGQILQIWDKLFGSVYHGKCICSRCARENGDRSLEKWEKVQKQDYGTLLTLGFWLGTGSKTDKKQ